MPTSRWMLWLAPAGLRGGLKLEAYHQSRQPHSLSLSPSLFWDSVPCIRSRESAGHMVMYFVTGQMVGDRRSPGATILGVEVVYFLRQPSLPGPPTGPEHSDASWCGRCTRWQVVYIQTGSFSRVCSGTSVLSTRGVAASFLTRCRGSRLLRPRRCGDFGLVSRHKPAEHRFLMFPLFPTLRRRVSHAEKRLRYQRFFTCRSAAAKSTPLTRRGAAAKSTPLTRRGAAAISTPLTRRGAAARSTPLCSSDVASMSWPDRGHHVPALTVTSGGRGVGSDVACSEKSSRGRERH